MHMHVCPCINLRTLMYVCTHSIFIIKNNKFKKYIKYKYTYQYSQHMHSRVSVIPKYYLVYCACLLQSKIVTDNLCSFTLHTSAGIYATG